MITQNFLPLQKLVLAQPNPDRRPIVIALQLALILTQGDGADMTILIVVFVVLGVVALVLVAIAARGGKLLRKVRFLHFLVESNHLRTVVICMESSS